MNRLQLSPVYYLFILSLFTLASCGFQLRGEVKLPAELRPVYILSENADSIGSAIRWRLAEQGIELASKREDAKLLIILSDEVWNRRVLSVSALSGKLEEIELTYRLDMRAEKTNGTELLPTVRFNSVRDFTFNEQAVLAKDAEEHVLRQELREDLVNQVLRRLEFIVAQQE